MSNITSTELDWLPAVDTNWEASLSRAKMASPENAKELFVELANRRLDWAQTLKLDRAAQKILALCDADTGTDAPLRLAVLGSSTVAHLLPGIRIGALRRRLVIKCYVASYGAYLQEISDSGSDLHRFNPQIILFALDSRHLWALGQRDRSQAIGHLRKCWAHAHSAFRCTIIQQTALPIFMPNAGNNEHRFAGSPHMFIEQLNAELRVAANESNVHLLSIDHFYRWLGGLDFWHDGGLWNHAKQEVSPRAAHLYGEQLGRLIAATQGASAKCLVLDLDNTIWGGVIGDDGLEGIVLGQGDAIGEAFVQMQEYACVQQSHGVILAVCSKNQEDNARLPFRSHPEMVLKEKDISCFVANWSNKADNIRFIARTLNISVDALVFVDDNPVERGLVRQQLPTVSVPELPDDPAGYVRCLQRAGYFEAVTFTLEDKTRTDFYASNVSRQKLKDSQSSFEDYLLALEMELSWRPFDVVNLTRIVQLTNKTNQFNLTTRRRSESDIIKMIDDDNIVTLQIKLKDIYGDNGIIAIVVGVCESDALRIDTWLMSCRVLERQVEYATLNIICEISAERGIKTIIGEYKPTDKNDLVRGLYEKLGFARCADKITNGSELWKLDIGSYSPRSVPIAIRG